LPKTTPGLVGEIPTMIVKIFDKNGLRIIERRYDYANHADIYNRLSAIDTVLKEFPNEPMPKSSSDRRQIQLCGIRLLATFRRRISIYEDLVDFLCPCCDELPDEWGFCRCQTATRDN
jgi:hypothetical protein